MKICIFQLNVDDFAPIKNAEKIVSAHNSVKDQGVRLYIIPAQALTGPGYRNFVDWPDYYDICKEALAILKADLPQDIPLIMGLPMPDINPLILYKGDLISTSYLTLDSYRFIIGINKDSNLLNFRDRIFINLNSWRFSVKNIEKSEDKYRADQNIIINPNLVGGYEERIYAGQSFVMLQGGKIAARAKAFEEDFLLFDLPATSNKIEPLCTGAEAIWKALVLGTADFIHKTGKEKAIVGLSGGMDSALAVCIAVEALGKENVIGVLMPSPYSSAGSIDDSLTLAQNLDIRTYQIPITLMMEAYHKSLMPIFADFPDNINDLTFENLQPRIRGTLLMALANRSGALVLNTGNKSEASMGYCTLYGDTVGALSVIGDLYKTQVYEIARWYNKYKGGAIIPENIFIKEPSAELRPNQKDTDSLPPYSKLDIILQGLSGNTSLPEDRKDEWLEIRQKVMMNKFKRKQFPPVLRIE